MESVQLGRRMLRRLKSRRRDLGNHDNFGCRKMIDDGRESNIQSGMFHC